MTMLLFYFLNKLKCYIYFTMNLPDFFFFGNTNTLMTLKGINQMHTLLLGVSFFFLNGQVHKGIFL